VIEMLDPHRALLDTRAARRALPELFLGDEVVEQPMVQDFRDGHAPFVALAVHERMVAELRTIAHEQRRLLH
jgi:hypothetical protein